MELHVLQRMISIIHDKKPKCRGNLRVKVLLKSTHDYVRRSLIDDQLGNSESLITLLRNSGTEREPMFSANSALETDLHSMNNDQVFTQIHTDSHSMDCDQISEQTTPVVNEQELESSLSCNQSMKHPSENIPSTNDAFPISEDNQNLNNLPIPAVISDMRIGLPDYEAFAFQNSNKNCDRNSYIKDKRKHFKLTKAVRKVMKGWTWLVSNPNLDYVYFKPHFRSVKKMRKCLLESKVCFKADFENHSFSQQQIIQRHLKAIEKMLKQCDNILVIKYLKKMKFSR